MRICWNIFQTVFFLFSQTKTNRPQKIIPTYFKSRNLWYFHPKNHGNQFTYAFYLYSTFYAEICIGNGKSTAINDDADKKWLAIHWKLKQWFFKECFRLNFNGITRLVTAAACLSTSTFISRVGRCWTSTRFGTMRVATISYKSTNKKRAFIRIHASLKRRKLLASKSTWIPIAPKNTLHRDISFW